MGAASGVGAVLYAQIACIERRHDVRAWAGHISTTFPRMDARCGGGLRRGAIHEFIGSGAASPYGARPTRFLGRILGRTTGPVLWVSAPRFDLHLAGLRAGHLSPDRVFCVEAPPDRLLAVAEDALREKGVTALVLDVTTPLTLTASRRLQLAAESSGVTGFILHRTTATPPPTACWSRWRIGPAPHAPMTSRGFLASERWSIDLLRLRGGEPASFTVEPDHDTPYPLPLSSGLADTTLVPSPSRNTRNIPAGAACA